jgi:hypothetical protein
VTSAGLTPAPAVGAGGDVADARRWLARIQNPDGGFGASPGTESSVGITTWAVLGLEAAGRNPHDVGRGRRSALDYLRAHADEARSTTDLERAILAIEGAGLDAGRFAGRDLVAELGSRRRRSGSFRDQVNITAFGVLALRAAGKPRSALDRSGRWLREAQNPDGGWGFSPETASDADSTGAALQALAAAGAGSSPAARDGVRYLRRAQRAEGGWPLASGGPTNSQSTAWAIQGLLAAGADPGSRAFGYLAARQASDGHYRYSAASDQTPVWVTAQALLAATESPFPLDPVPRASRQPSVATAAEPRGGNGGAQKAASGSPSPSDPAAATRTRSEGGGEGEPRRERRSQPEARAARSRRPAHEALAAAGHPAPLAPSLAAEGEDGGLEPLLAAGFALMVLALAAGFLWYRRRLP